MDLTVFFFKELNELIQVKHLERSWNLVIVAITTDTPEHKSMTFWLISSHQGNI